MNMAHLQGQERADYVQNMFDRIAGRYNVMNRLMTGGQDMRWRRFVIQKAQLPPAGKLLDLATGTGDIGFEALKAVPDAQVIGADFSLGMMQVGKRLPDGNRMSWSGADALKLPFPDNTFDAVTSGYLVRNVIDIPQTLSEQLRVLKPGGRIVILDSSPPPPTIMRPLIEIHLRYIIPMLGRIVAGENGADAYQYLPSSTQAFKSPDELAAIMRQAGIQDVEYRTFMFGTMAVHWGRKDEQKTS
jgi:demethylmenaquinone methyltransferase/2-methoxy-6-polyprenyl-1,4-benzoquinol methylase